MSKEKWLRELSGALSNWKSHYYTHKRYRCHVPPELRDLPIVCAKCERTYWRVVKAQAVVRVLWRIA